MRLRIVMNNETVTAVPIHYQEYLTAAVYSFLGRSDADYARFLHDQGYSSVGTKTFKFFTYSYLRGRRLSISEGHIRFAPGPLEWFVSSPIDDFIKNFATGLLTTGQLVIGSVRFEIGLVEALPEPDFTQGKARMTCLSPIVVSQPLPNGGTYYVRPGEGINFSEGVKKNLIAKYAILHGKQPLDDTFSLTFDPAYLARARGGTKLQTFKETQMVGAFAPFQVTASPEMLKTFFDCGGGKSNSLGLGMVEVAR